MVQLLEFTPERSNLIENGLEPFLGKLKRFSVGDIFIDGSFVTDKPRPGDIDGYVKTKFMDELSRYLEETRDTFKEELGVDFYPALTDFDGMGSVEYFNDVFKATNDTPPKLKGYLVIGDWRKHV